MEKCEKRRLKLTENIKICTENEIILHSIVCNSNIKLFIPDNCTIANVRSKFLFQRKEEREKKN